MTLNEKRRPTPDRSATSAGGGGGLGGLPIPIPRGPVGLIVLAVLVIGGHRRRQLAARRRRQPTRATATLSCPVGAQQDVKCRNALYVNSIQDYWQTALPAGVRRRRTSRPTPSSSTRR